MAQKRHAWLVVAVLMFSVRAQANPLDTFGYTSADIAMGGGVTALAGSYDACYYNPAGLALLDGFDVGLGVQVFRPFLKSSINRLDASTGVIEPRQVSRGSTGTLFDLGIASPIPLGKGLDRHLFWGIQAAFPGSTLYAVRERPVQEAYFPFMEERNRRLVLNGALAGRWKWLMVGVGVSLLPNVYGRVDVDFTREGRANQTEVDVKMNLSPNVGALVEPIPGLTVGLTWRGANRTHLSIPVNAVLSDKIAAIRLKVLAYDYSTPHQIALGLAYQKPGYRVAADVTYSMYRDFRQSAPSVLLYSSSADDKVIKETLVPDANFRNSWAVRLGGEWRPVAALALRAGFGWVQSPVPAQTGVTNFLDGDRYMGSIGLGFDAASVGGPPLSVDLHMQYAWMVGHRDAKTVFDPGNPGYPSVASEGWALNGGMTLRYRF